MDVESAVGTGAGIATGLGTTATIRWQLDASGETTVFRPSVLWGVLTGVAGLGAPMLLDVDGAAGKFAQDYGVAAFVAGTFSAINPKGGNTQLPTL